MKTYKTIVFLVAMVFIVITAALLLALIFDMVQSEEAKNTITKIAEACGVVALAGILLSFLSKTAQK